MDYLSSENLFFSKYVIGCELPNNTNIDCIKTLHNWLYFKDNDYGMSRYRTDRTQFIAFLNIIDLPVLKEIINDLIIIYKKEYPFGEKADFIEQIFSYTLYSLESFVEYENYTFYGTPPNIKNEVYYKFERDDNEYIEFVTEPVKDIEYYQQYYKKVIEMINNLDFENPQIKSKPRQQKKNLQNMRDKLFEINEKNYLDLVKEYSFSENEGFFIHRNFWPIIVVNSYDTDWVKNQLEHYKIEFIKENKIFDLDIFKRNELDFLIFELDEYLDNIKKGKTKIWNECKGDYFHWFKLQSDMKSYTLLISDKNEIQLEIYFKTLLSEINLFIEKEQALPLNQTETKPEQVTILIKPIVKPEAVQPLFDIIKDFFAPEQQTELKRILENGSNANEKLVFKGNGNRLTDIFKQLIEYDIITGCQKQDLINWIILNFNFTYRGEVRIFIYDTVEKIISRNDNPCKSPLIKISKGQILKIEQARKKNTTKY